MKSSLLKYKRSFLRLIMLLWSISYSSGTTAHPQKGNAPNEADTFPVPPANPRMMFYLQRTPNTNTIVYALNFDNEGKLKPAEPIRVYWIRYTEPGYPVRSLNYIQRTFAYGIKSKRTGGDEWELRIVAYDKLPLYLRMGKHGNYQVYALLNNRAVIFSKAYIKIAEGGTFWRPNVRYIELSGTDETNGDNIVQRIKPK